MTRPSDPALLHYRSGGFYAARAARAGRTGSVRDVLLSLTCSSRDPMSGGRHKVFGHPDLHIIPQTSTIGSHLPRAVGLAYSLDLARTLDRRTPWPDDAIVVCSFGDASANHSTVTGALNAASYLAHRQLACPVLFVCEDNRIGISTPSPRGWPGAALESLPGITYLRAEGADPQTPPRADGPGGRSGPRDPPPGRDASRRGPLHGSCGLGRRVRIPKPSRDREGLREGPAARHGTLPARGGTRHGGRGPRVVRGGPCPSHGGGRARPGRTPPVQPGRGGGAADAAGGAG